MQRYFGGTIMEKYAASGWDLISVPAQQWLDGKADKDALLPSESTNSTTQFLPILVNG